MSKLINFYKNIARKFSQENTKLKKKFYKKVDVLEVKNDNITPLGETTYQYLQNLSNLGDSYYRVLLDNKKCRTLYSDELILPKKKLALGIAEEFERQKEDINFYSMHLVFRYLI
jgi:chaperone required for assembly of F1-ATPase